MNNWHSGDEYKGKTVAIDASPCLYQCLTTSPTPGSEGDTSHISGFLRRTVRLLELGIQPIFVFDGDAPELKQATLARRKQGRARSQELLDSAQAAGDLEAVRKYSARLVKTTQQHNDDCIELLQLMGMPALQAPSEAECLCSHLAMAGRVDAVATEDLDALVFGAPKLLRFIHQGVSQVSVKAIQEISLEGVLSSLKLSHSEFVDLCIMSGCDYLENIERVGINKAYQLITQHRNLEAVVQHLSNTKHKAPEDWNFKPVRAWFSAPLVGDVASYCLGRSSMQQEKLYEFLVHKHQLDSGMVRDHLHRLAIVTGAPESSNAAGNIAQAIPTPVRVRSTETESKGKELRTSVLQPSPGQCTLHRFLKSGEKRPPVNVAALVETGPCEKRRRLDAEEALSRELGSSIEVPASAPVEELEVLAALLSGETPTIANAFGNQEVVTLD
jgi:flap endonuclease-1